MFPSRIYGVINSFSSGGNEFFGEVYKFEANKDAFYI
jgi:hypothetical protein